MPRTVLKSPVALGAVLRACVGVCSPSVVRSEPPETPSWRDEIVEVKVSFPARLQHLVFGQTGQAEQKKRHEDRLAVRLTTKDDLPDEVCLFSILVE